MLKLIGVGRLTKDLEILTVTNDKNTKVANFTLACRDNNETEFVQCTAWNEIAKAIKENTKQGSMLYVEGRYKTKEYIDDKTQIKHKRIFINVEKFEFLGKKPHDETLEEKAIFEEQKKIQTLMEEHQLSFMDLQKLLNKVNDEATAIDEPMQHYGLE